MIFHHQTRYAHTLNYTFRLEDVTGQTNIAVKLGLRISDDTYMHQANRVYCSITFVILAVFVSAKQYVGEPISCFAPYNSEKAHMGYVNTYCWVKNTYTVLDHESLPDDDEQIRGLEIGYYQYVPILFALMAFMFYCPRIFWKITVPTSGLNIKRVLMIANDATYLEHEERVEKLGYVANHLDKWIEIRDTVFSNYRKMRKIKTSLANHGIHSGKSLSFFHLVTCFLYAANSVALFFLINAMMNNTFYNLGFEIIHDIFVHSEWHDLSRFPRVTFCDFQIRQLANVQTWTVQCSIPINMFNEKAFAIVWFILIGISIANIITFIYNIFVFFLPWNAQEYVIKYLSFARAQRIVHDKHMVKQIMSRFVDEYLRQDGAFIIYLLSHHVSRVIGAQVVGIMWNNYLRRPDIRLYFTGTETNGNSS